MFHRRRDPADVAEERVSQWNGTQKHFQSPGGEKRRERNREKGGLISSSPVLPLSSVPTV
jgi:hypothetical protein